MRVFHIELRVDDKLGDELLEGIKQIAVEKARELYTTALLVSGSRKPQIALHSSDFFAGQDDIVLTGDDITAS
jgi:hypothetical protein